MRWFQSRDAFVLLNIILRTLRCPTEKRTQFPTLMATTMLFARECVHFGGEMDKNFLLSPRGRSEWRFCHVSNESRAKVSDVSRWGQRVGSVTSSNKPKPPPSTHLSTRLTVPQRQIEINSFHSVINSLKSSINSFTFSRCYLTPFESLFRFSLSSRNQLSRAVKVINFLRFCSYFYYCHSQFITSLLLRGS